MSPSLREVHGKKKKQGAKKGYMDEWMFFVLFEGPCIAHDPFYLESANLRLLQWCIIIDKGVVQDMFVHLFNGDVRNIMDLTFFGNI